MENLSKEDKIYYDKYLKYKEKYLNLKKVGGLFGDVTPPTRASMMEEKKSPESEKVEVVEVEEKEVEVEEEVVEVEEEDDSSTEEEVEEEEEEDEEEIQPVEEKASEPEPSSNPFLQYYEDVYKDVQEFYDKGKTGTAAAIAVAAAVDSTVTGVLYAISIPVGLGITGLKLFSNSIGLVKNTYLKNDFLTSYFSAKFYYNLVDTSINQKRMDADKEDPNVEIPKLNLSDAFVQYLKAEKDANFKKIFISKIINTTNLVFFDKNIEALNSFNENNDNKDNKVQKIFIEELDEKMLLTNELIRTTMLNYSNINLEVLDKLSNDLISKANKSTAKCDAKNNAEIDDMENKIENEQTDKDQENFKGLSPGEIDTQRDKILYNDVDAKEILVRPQTKVLSYFSKLFKGKTNEEKEAEKKAAEKLKKDCSDKKEIMYEGFCIAVMICWFLYDKYEKTYQNQQDKDLGNMRQDSFSSENKLTAADVKAMANTLENRETESNNIKTLIAKKKEELQKALYHKSTMGSKMGFLYKYLEKTGQIEKYKEVNEQVLTEIQEKDLDDDIESVINLVYDAGNLIHNDIINENKKAEEDKKKREAYYEKMKNPKSWFGNSEEATAEEAPPKEE